MPFVKGDKNINRKGAPQKGKAMLPLLRDKLFALALKRMKRDPEMESLTNETLVRFIAANLPKDLSLAVSNDRVIEYHSNVPRPDMQNSELQQKTENIIDVSPSQSTQVNDTDIDSNIDQVNIPCIIGSRSTNWI
jgi:hypothetical protein